MKKKSITFLLILFLTFAVTKLYFHSGFPYTHDGENHLARFANYVLALRELQFPPRFAPNLFSHYGYPVFNFNYPLANILSVPFSLLKLNYEVAFKAIVISGIVFGLIGVAQWLEKLRFSTKAQRFSVAAFALNSYLLSAVYFRGNIGEILALCLFPWLFWGVEKCREEKLHLWEAMGLIGIGTAFLLSHNISAVFGSALLLVYAIFRFGKDRESWQKVLVLFGCSFGLSLWFWLPALLEKNFTVVDQANVNELFLQHFPTLSQLLFSPLKFGFSFAGSIDSLPFSVGMVQVVSIFLALILGVMSLLRFSREKKALERHEKVFLFSLGMSLLFFVFQLPFTSLLWQGLLPIAKYLQFPWRLSLFLHILLIPVIAYVFQNVRTTMKCILVGLLTLQLLYTLQLKPVDYFHRDIIDYDFFSQSTSTGNENRAKTFTYSNIADWKPTPIILQGKGTFDEILKWRGSHREYLVYLNEESVIVEPTMNFPGWETYFTVYEMLGERRKATYIDSDEIGGRIAYKLPYGMYFVESSFTQWTWPRVIGNMVSLGTALGLSGFLVYSMVKKRTYGHS